MPLRNSKDRAKGRQGEEPAVGLENGQGQVRRGLEGNVTNFGLYFMCEV